MENEFKADNLEAGFFHRDVHDVARDLLGRNLARKVSGQIRRGRIVEVEVYEGENDLASHARSGEPTERTAPMFAEPGTIYVYTIYGMYHCLNLRAPASGGPGAILIRACEPLVGREEMALSRGLVEERAQYRRGLAKKLMSGPGKLCQALDIRPSLSGRPIGGELFVEIGEPVWRVDPRQVEATERVGLNPKTCGECVNWPWRYVISGSEWASR